MKFRKGDIVGVNRGKGEEEAEVLEPDNGPEVLANGSSGGLLVCVEFADGVLYTTRESDITPRQAVIQPQRKTWTQGERPTN